jgi:hypothetical protein
MSGFARMLIHTCTVYRRGAGTADFGNPSGSYAVAMSDVPCRRHERTSPDHDFPGEVVEEISMFWFRSETDIRLKDQLDFGGERFDVVKIVEDVCGVGEIRRVIATRSEVD